MAFPINTQLKHAHGRCPFAISRDNATPLDDALAWLTGREIEPFDLTSCAFTTALAKVGDGHWVWSLNQHHVITDFTSSKLLVERLAEIYALRQQGVNETPDYPSFLGFMAITCLIPNRSGLSDPDLRACTRR